VIGSVLREAAARLAALGIEAPLREARLLLGAATGLDQAALIGWPERGIEPDAIRRFRAMIDRRVAREPVSRILGGREFWSLDFTVTPATLDPRPETEILVEAVLDRFSDRQAALRLADFGTGTGCILLALLSELPNAWGVGIDRSAAAAGIAARNAADLKLGGRAAFITGDWAEAIGYGLDVAVANPPYIPSGVIAALDPEVARYDPRAALDGGADGLNAYRRLLPRLAALIRPGGIVAVEIGIGQSGEVARLGRASGLQVLETRPDLAGIARVVVLGNAECTK
jgi:release factor glutamine methyltransferase